jgi:catechol 2,3-dioxygenase-like lactoylglutathione lyase family enzyme
MATEVLWEGDAAMTFIRGLAEIVLSVHDLAASLRFYRDTLGLTLVSAPDFRPAFLRAGDPAVTVPQLVVLVPLPAGTPPFPAAKPGRTLHHLAFELAPADFDAMRDHLAAQGHAIRTGQHPVIPSRTMYIDDPDGNEVEFIAGT